MLVAMIGAGVMDLAGDVLVPVLLLHAPLMVMVVHVLVRVGMAVCRAVRMRVFMRVRVLVAVRVHAPDIRRSLGHVESHP